MGIKNQEIGLDDTAALLEIAFWVDFFADPSEEFEITLLVQYNRLIER